MSQNWRKYLENNDENEIPQKKNKERGKGKKLKKMKKQKEDDWG